MADPAVCVVGSGTAGLEGLLAAREALGTSAALQLIAPDREFRFRPMSPDSLFRPASEQGIAIADLVEQADATWLADRADLVDLRSRTVVTREGETAAYDFLLLATGSRPERPLRQGHVWERGADPHFLDATIEAVTGGSAARVAVVVPRGARWPIPAYELALVLAWSAAGTDAEITLITAEARPLGALGSDASETLVGELAQAGVRVLAGVEALDDPRRDPGPEGSARLLLAPESRAEQSGALLGAPRDPDAVRSNDDASESFDRLIALPTVVGRPVSGLPTDAAGFIEVDEDLRVCGDEHAWAAGGCIAAALEHSALSAGQADAAVSAIATAAGVPGGRISPPDLTGLLLTDQRDRWLAENPPGTPEPSTRCLWWPPGRAVGRMLARRIAAWDPDLHHALEELPAGLGISAPVALGCEQPATVRPLGEDGSEPDAEERMSRLRDIDNRQLMAVARREREADAELRALSGRLETLAESQEQAIRELRAHGYLRHRAAPPRKGRGGR